MEAEVAPKTITAVFVVVSFVEALHLLLWATAPALAFIWENLDSTIPLRLVFVPVRIAFASVPPILLAVLIGLLFIRRLMKMRELRSEPNPHIGSVLGGSALLVLALQLVSWGTQPLTVWVLNITGFISFRQHSAVLEFVTMSRGLAPVSLVVIAGLLLVVCFGMTRPRMAFVDEEHEVWDREPVKEEA